MLSACTAVDDGRNADRTTEQIRDQQKAQPETNAAKADFPKLKTVPERPVPEMTAEKRREIARELLADRAKARQSAQRLRALDTGSAAPPRQQK